MTRIQQRASVHEKTVQAVAKDELEPPKRRRRRTQTVDQHPEWALKVNDQVWEDVKAYEWFSPTHVQINDDGSVVIWNYPNNSQFPWPELQV